jgi:hypothetical protein
MVLADVFLEKGLAFEYGLVKPDEDMSQSDSSQFDEFARHYPYWVKITDQSGEIIDSWNATGLKHIFVEANKKLVSRT